MPDQPDDITRLRNAHYAFEELPDTITFAQQPGSSSNRGPLPIADATIDDIAIAIVAAEEAASEFRRRIFALQHLYKSAREMGCIGTDRAVEIVLKKGGR